MGFLRGGNTNKIDARNQETDMKTKKVEQSNKRAKDRNAMRNKRASQKSSLISGSYTGIEEDTLG